MSLVNANSDNIQDTKPSLANASAEKKSILLGLARKQIEQERAKSGKGKIPATDLKDDSPELQQALDRLDLSDTANMSADEMKALESTTHEQAQKKQDDTIMKTTVASDMIFYAYARRTDSKDWSRYLLNFANAGVAQEWWEIVHAEYPEAERHGPQFFSFKGDDIPGKAWDNKKLEHLKTKWFWTRMDDSGGRQQPVIPLQDAKGYVIGYATNTTTAYVGTNIHSSSSATSSQSSTNMTGTQNVAASSTGAAAGATGASLSVSSELSAVITQQALHLKQVQELIAAQSAQIAAWGQLLSVLLQGGQLTTIQSLQGTDVGANLSQIIASLTLTSGISQGTVQNAVSAGNTGAGGTNTVTSGQNVAQHGVSGVSGGNGVNGVNGSSSSSITNTMNGGSNTGFGNSSSSGTLLLPGTGSNLSKAPSSSTVGQTGTTSSTSTNTTITHEIVTAAAQASSAGHASGYESGHAAGFAAGFKACQGQQTVTSSSTGGYDLPGMGGNLNTTLNVQDGGHRQTTSSVATGNGGFGAAIQIDGVGQQGSAGGYTSNLSSSTGGVANNSYSIDTNGSRGGQWGGSYTTSYGLGGTGSTSGFGNISTSITAGQGGTVNAGRMTFNNSSFSTAVSDIAIRRATWLSQSGDPRSQQEILRGILQSCLNEGHLTLKVGVQSNLSPMIVDGQGGTVKAGQMMINGQTFGAFVDKASTMRSQQLAGLGDMRPIKDIYTGVFSGLLAELEEFVNSARS